MFGVTLYSGSIIGDSLMNVHGILVRDSLDAISKEEAEVITKLLQSGSLIDANSFLSTLNNFYSTTIQLLIGFFVVFGLISFVALKTHSSREIEAQVDLVIGKTFEDYLGSIRFAEYISSEVRTNFQIEVEDILESYSTSDAGEINGRMSELEKYLAEIAETVAQSSNPNGDDN